MSTTTTAPGLVAGTWTVDPAHSHVAFEARHAMISKVRGEFTSYQAQVHIDRDVTKSTVRASVDLASVQTGNAQRDEHLRSSDFFLVEQHPQMIFQSTGVRGDGDGDDFVLAGNLTVRGVTKPVEFDLEFNGVTIDPFGNTRAGFSASTTVNRKDWGLDWNVPLEKGMGVLVGDKIKVSLDIALILQADS
jgi:polyisoprenoid-binding protein YceI